MSTIYNELKSMQTKNNSDIRDVECLKCLMKPSEHIEITKTRCFKKAAHVTKIRQMLQNVVAWTN